MTRRVAIGVAVLVLAAGVIGVRLLGPPNASRDRDDESSDVDSPLDDFRLSTRPGSVPSVDEAESDAGDVEFVARWEVTVRGARDGKPVAGARLEVSFPLAESRRLAGPTLYRSALTNRDGVAVLERMPVGRDVALAVERAWFLVAQTTVEASDDEARRVDVSLEPTLTPEESAARVEVAVDPAAVGVDLAALRVYHAADVPGRDLVRAGDSVYISNRGDAVGARDARLQVLMPGYAGPLVAATLERGRATIIAFAPPAPVALEFVVRTTGGVPAAGAIVELVPANAPSHHRAAFAVRAWTDRRGVATLATRAGAEVAVRVLGPTTYFPPEWWTFVASEASRSHELVVVPLATLTLELEGDPLGAKGVATLRWSDVRLAPDVDASLEQAGSPVRDASPSTAYRERLPARMRWTVESDGVRRARTALLPGSYALEVAAAGLSSAGEAFAVPAGGATVRVALRRPGVFSFRVASDVGGSESGALAGALVIGHAAAFDERFRVVQALGPAWRGPDVLARLDANAREAAIRIAAASLRRLRGHDPRVPGDVDVVGADGRVSIESHASPSTITIVVAGRGAALVRATTGSGAAGSSVADLVVATAALGHVAVRAGGDGGRPWGGLRLFVNPVANVAEQRLELSVERTTDADGRAVVEALPGDEFALYAETPLDASASGGAVAERRAWRNGERQFVVVRWAGSEDAAIALRPGR